MPITRGDSHYDYGVRGLDLESMRMFLIAYEEGNLTRAANYSHIALSALTKRIQNLEYVLQTPLFVRHARGIWATPAGHEFAYQVRDILKRLSFARQSIGEFSAGIRGRIRISATPSAIVGGLAEDITQFLQEHPHMEIDLKESASWSIIPDIESGRTDIGINMSILETPQNLTKKFYRSANLVVIVAPGHPLAALPKVGFSELIDFEVISIGERSTLRDFLTKHAEKRHRFIKFKIVSSFDVVRSMVAAGLGIGVIPEMLTKPPHDQTKIVLIPIAEKWASRSLNIWFREDSLVPASRLFCDYLLGFKPS